MWGLIFSSLGFIAAAHAALEVKLDKTQSQLGEPLLLQIKSAADLSALDMSPITQNFELASQTLNRSSGLGGEQYMLEATLYPLRSGVLTVPKLVMGTITSRAVSILIQPAKVSVLAWFPPGMPMEREATVLHLEIRDDGSLSWDTPIQIDAPYTAIRALPESMHEESQGGIKSVVHHFRWQILPLKEGSVAVNIGMLDAHRYAQRLRFPGGSVSLNVRPAPVYLPLNVPIGKPAIRADRRPQRMVAGKPGAWNMYVHAPGLSAEGANNLLQYNVPAGLRFYPPSIAPVMLDGEEYLRITLSFIADRSARIFPEIRLPYFDQRQQRIETLVLPASSLQVHDLVRQRFIAAGIVMVGVSMLAPFGWMGWRLSQRRHAKRQWLARISAAQTPALLHAALTRDSPWQVRSLRRLPSRLKIDPRAVAQLERACFAMANEPGVFPELKKKWQQAIAKIPVHFFSAQKILQRCRKLTDVKSPSLGTNGFRHLR